MENRKEVIEILQAVRHSSSDIEKQADRICALFNVVKSFPNTIEIAKVAMERKYEFGEHLPYHPKDFIDGANWLKEQITK